MSVLEFSSTRGICRSVQPAYFFYFLRVLMRAPRNSVLQFPPCPSVWQLLGNADELVSADSTVLLVDILTHELCC